MEIKINNLKQKALGLLFLAISAVVLLVASKGNNNEATAVLAFVPLGLYLLCSKKNLLEYDFEDEE